MIRKAIDEDELNEEVERIKKDPRVERNAERGRARLAIAIIRAVSAQTGGASLYY